MEGPRQSPSAWWSDVMAYGYALWFVATLGLLGFLAGWQLDRLTGRFFGRIVLTLLGVIGGAAVARVVLRGHRRRQRS